MTGRERYPLAARLGHMLKAKGLMLATAESCTGGGIAAAVTAVAGSSAWFDRGFVTYTVVSKREMLGVKAETLSDYGAVSEQTAREMLEGTLARSHAQLAVSVSGTAGPCGGTPDKPVGTVCFGWGMAGGTVQTATRHFEGDREAVRSQAVEYALEKAFELAMQASPTFNADGC